MALLPLAVAVAIYIARRRRRHHTAFLCSMASPYFLSSRSWRCHNLWMSISSWATPEALGPRGPSRTAPDRCSPVSKPGRPGHDHRPPGLLAHHSPLCHAVGLPSLEKQNPTPQYAWDTAGGAGEARTPPTVPDALLTLSYGLAQLAEALDSGSGVPVGLATIFNGLANGHHSNNGHLPDEAYPRTLNPSVASEGAASRFSTICCRAPVPTTGIIRQSRVPSLLIALNSRKSTNKPGGSVGYAGTLISRPPSTLSATTFDANESCTTTPTGIPSPIPAPTQWDRAALSTTAGKGIRNLGPMAVLYTRHWALFG